MGISKDGKSLTAGHESVNRCLHEVCLGGVDEKHLLEIISLGEKGLGLRFDDEIKNQIVDISNGFPYFTHLLCKEAAEAAIVDSSKVINSEIFHKSIEKSVENAEGRLRREYEDAVRSSKTDVYKKFYIQRQSLKMRSLALKNG